MSQNTSYLFRLSLRQGMLWLGLAAFSASLSAETLVDSVLANTQTWSEQITIQGSGRANESVDIRSRIQRKITQIGFESGDQVMAGRLLFQLDDAEEQARLRAAKAILSERQSALKRAQQLHTRKVGSRADLDVAQAQVQESQANIEAINSLLASHRIRAPFGGKLGLRQFSTGALVGPDDILTTLDDLSRIQVDFAVPVSFLSRVQTNGVIAATTPAYPGEMFTGKVTHLDTRVDTRTRTIRVRAQFNNAEERLRPGMLFRASLQSKARDSISLPERAVFNRGRETFVYRIVEEDSEFRALETRVQLGQRQDGRVEILDGIQPQERVVLSGGLKLSDGSAVILSETRIP